MRSVRKMEIARQIEHHLEAGSTDMADAELRYSTAGYTDPDVLAKERATLFRTLPIALATSSELPAAGSFLTHDLAGVPLLLSRQKDGTVKVFLNACRHRGARLVHEKSGTKPAFACQFHGWSYRADGASLGVPGEVGFCNTGKAERELIEFPSEERHGFIWAVLDADAQIDVAAFLGAELDDELAEYKLQDYRVARAMDVRQPINWKCFLEGFLETYHFSSLHRATVGPYFVSNTALAKTYGPHGRMVAARRSYKEARAEQQGEFDVLKHTAVTYTIFPNLVIELLSDRYSFHFEIWMVFPSSTDPGQGYARALLLAEASKLTPEHETFWDKNWQITHNTVLGEDLKVCEGLQNAAGSGALKEVVFGRNEPLLQHFHRQVLQRIT